MKTLAHVATEMALHVLAYNIKRVIAILNVPELIKGIVAFLLFLVIAMRLSRAVWSLHRSFRASYA